MSTSIKRDRLTALRAAAEAAGTRFVGASRGIAPTVGGAVTYHKVAFAIAEQLRDRCNAIGAEARILGKAGQVYVYLSSGSFEQGDRL